MHFLSVNEKLHLGFVASSATWPLVDVSSCSQLQNCLSQQLPLEYGLPQVRRHNHYTERQW